MRVLPLVLLLVCAPAVAQVSHRVAARASGFYLTTDGAMRTMGKYDPGDSLEVLGTERSLAVVRMSDGRPAHVLALNLIIPAELVPVFDEMGREATRREAARADSVRAAEAALREATMRNRPPVLIRGVIPSAPNSADGVGLTGYFWYSDPERTLKYLRLRVRPYNAVGDPVTSQTGGEGSVTVSFTGPLEADYDLVDLTWDNVWYNPTISCVLIERAEAEYMSGSSEVYVRDLPNVLEMPWPNDCSYEAQRERARSLR